MPRAIVIVYSGSEVRARPPDARTRDDHRPLGRSQELHRLAHIRRRRRHRSRTDRPPIAAFLREQVHRDRQVDGAFPSCVGDTIRPLEVARNFRGVRRLGRPLRDRPGHRHLIDILERLPVRHRAGAAAADRDQRTAGELRGRDASERVRVARAAGHQRQRRLAMQTRPRVGRMRDTRLVAEVDNPDAGARRLGEDFVQMIADKGKDRVEAQLFTSSHECGGPVWHRNAMLLHSNQWLNERSS
jgi:hypothetical protein